MSDKLELESLFDNTSVFAYQLGFRFPTVHYISNSVSGILGFSEADFKTEKSGFFGFVHKEDRQIFQQFFDDDTKKELKVLLRMQHTDSSFIYTKHYLKKIQKKDEVRIEGLAIDVNESEKDKLALKQEREYSQNIFRSLQDGLSVVNADFSHGIVNASFLKQIGFELEEILGTMPPYPYWPEEELENIKSAFEKATSGEVSTYELVFKKKSGERFPVLVSPAPVFDAKGKPVSFIATVKDISELKRSQQELKESEEMFRLLSEQGLMSVFLVQDQKMVYFNDSFCRITGYEKSEIQEWKPGGVFERVHDDYREFVISQYNKKIKGEEEVVTHYELKFVHKSGEVRWIELWSKGVSYNGKQADLVMFLDIHEKKKFEEGLKKSESWYKILFEKVSDATLILEDFIIVNHNSKALDFFGVKGTFFLNQHIQNFIPEGKGGELLDRIGQVSGYDKLRIEQEFKVGDVVFETEVGVSIQEVAGGNQVLLSIRDISETKKHERELEAELRYVRNAMENLPVGVGIVSREGGITYFNKQFTKQYGYELEDFEHVSDWFEMAYPDPIYRSIIMKEWDNSVAYYTEHGFVDPMEVEIVSKDRKVRNSLISFEVINGDFVIIFNDVTERKKNERELNESQYMLQKILDTIPVRVFWKNKNSVYLGCNKVFFEDAGLQEGDTIVGKTDFDLDWKENAYSFRKDDKLVVSSEKPKLGFEEVQERPDGKKSWLLTSKVPLHDSEGVLIGVLGTYDDITRLKEIEKELTNHKNNLEKLVDDRTREIHVLNEELTQTNEEIIAANNNLYEQKEYLEEAMLKLKETQSQLVQSEKMASLGVLTAGIAHEINNPVNFISSALEGLEVVLQSLKKLVVAYDGIDDENYQEKLVEIEQLKIKIRYHILLSSLEKITSNMRSGVRRTTAIIKSLRVFSRADEGEFQKADVNEMIESALVILHHQYKSRIKVSKLFSDLPPVFCYPGKLSQVFMNLLSNAIQAIDKEGKITITTSVVPDKSPSELVVSIEDSGNGIPDEIRNKIFEPFFTTKPVGKGTGLGLAISYGIIQEHRGRIEVQKSDGKGTVFSIYIPVST
ncbi:PAS domain S-box protein [Flammeovirgaceae bacterium SG7u.111]|nr:PAS domain S-box protein [Flammeovirgaceae bacterium SG7u.132]WPO36883.1 PAS domain S-box protein [Flammeovirgaceae bacterium SG7u.111]